ncbi:RNA 2',3'-cyclic phosphodiesterase [Halobacteriales archaeon QH_10_67_13]|nr:MAG: RNA 2',3'-cyclic phosphodiesterase [Halobacteriales archaeon QH_10_67_13]
MRLFVSVDLGELAPEIERLQSLFEGADGLRFTDPEQAHVTLTYLGETDPERVPEIETALRGAVEDAGVEPFRAAVGGLGVFPHPGYIRVVWVGIREDGGAGELRALHEAVEERTTTLGFEPDDHEFTPHATLARMDHAGGKELVQEVIQTRDPDASTVRVKEIRLTESRLGSEGSEYDTVAAVELSS